MGWCCEEGLLDDGPPYLRGCLDSLKLAGLALLLATSIALQILACALYSNWWPMLTFLMYILLPMPLLFFTNGSATDMFNSSDSGDWVDLAKLLTGFSLIGSIAIPSILFHAGVIEVAALCLTFSSLFVLMVTIGLFVAMSASSGLLE